MPLRIDIDGLGGALRRLSNLPGEITGAVVEEVQDTAGAVEDQAVDLAPVDRGVLAEAIENRPRQGGRVSDIGVWDDDAYYSRFVHDGTSSIPADPFLRAAYETYAPGLPGRIAAAVNRAVRGGGE